MRFAKLLLLFALPFTGCSNSNEALLARLNKAVDPVRNLHQGYRVVDLKDLTDFPWDSMYVFHGEEGISYIQWIIRLKWNGPAVPNLHKRLVFVHEGKVVTYVDCNEEEDIDGSVKRPALPIFIYSCNGEPERRFARNTARFAVFRYCGKGSMHYPFVPLGCLTDFKDMLTQGCPTPEQQVE